MKRFIFRVAKSVCRYLLDLGHCCPDLQVFIFYFFIWGEGEFCYYDFETCTIRLCVLTFACM